MSCNAAEWCGTVVERVMQDYSKYCNDEINFTCAVLSISSISSVTLTYMWSKGVHACSIHVTRVISFTLVNICKIINIKKKNCNWEKVAEQILVFLSCGSRLKHFTLPLTRVFLGSPKFKCIIITIVFRPTFISFLYKVCW